MKTYQMAALFGRSSREVDEIEYRLSPLTSRVDLCHSEECSGNLIKEEKIFGGHWDI